MGAASFLPPTAVLQMDNHPADLSSDMLVTSCALAVFSLPIVGFRRTHFPLRNTKRINEER